MKQQNDKMRKDDFKVLDEFIKFNTKKIEEKVNKLTEKINHRFWIDPDTTSRYIKK